MIRQQTPRSETPTSPTPLIPSSQQTTIPIIQKIKDIHLPHLPPFLENIGDRVKNAQNFTYPNFPENKVISTELECFLQPESPREYSSSNLRELQPLNEKQTSQSTNSLLIDIDENLIDYDHNEYELGTNSKSLDKDIKGIPIPQPLTSTTSTTSLSLSLSLSHDIQKDSKHKQKQKQKQKHKHKHKHQKYKSLKRRPHKRDRIRLQRSGICGKLSHWDHRASGKIHEMACGAIDYLFVFGAFVFGSKFMPITILLSIFVVNISGFLFTGIACTITVTITEFTKKYFARHRPDPTTFGPKVLDFRTRLTNFSFPSGDTAQSASYSVALYFLTNNVWLLLFIPNCAWSRIYFGCHYVGDCVAGAIIGIIVPVILWAMVPHSALSMTQDRIEHWIYGL